MITVAKNSINIILFSGQCGRDFPASKDSFQLPTGSAGTGNGGGGASSSILAASNAVTAMEAPDDVNSDHDIDTEQESSLSEVICPNGRHKWKHDQCLVCTVCGECTGNNALLPISEFVLDEMFQRNTSNFAIFYIYE